VDNFVYVAWYENECIEDGFVATFLDSIPKKGTGLALDIFEQNYN